MNKTIIKPGSRFLLNQILEKYTNSKIFMFTGNNSYDQSGASKIFRSKKLKKNIYRQKVSTQTVELKEVFRIKNILNKNKFNLIVAIGGGAVIDTAKLVNLANSIESKNPLKLLNPSNIKNSLLPLFVLPTTFGTGSEETDFATVYYKNKKFSVYHPKLKPNLAIIDPELTYSLSSFNSACCGFDALSQCIESYWSISSTKKSRKLAYQGIKIIKSNLLDAVKNISNQAKLKMAIASNLSGKAIAITKTTAPHALSYEITRKLRIPHGYAVALLLGKFFIINDEISRVRNPMTKRKKQIRTKKIYNILGVSCAQEAEKEWYNLMNKCGLETNFKTLGLTDEENTQDFLKKVNLERLRNHPVELNKNKLRKIFYL